ncbi:MAG: hypothetical protein IJ043_04970 [Clostridia bacterium]|nr:hypothetical protein [Clostridia bacterium]
MLSPFENYNTDLPFSTVGGLDEGAILRETASLPPAQRKAAVAVAFLERGSLSLRAGELFTAHVPGAAVVRRLSKERAAPWMEPAPAGAYPSMDFGHIAPDWGYVLERGLPGILEDIKNCLPHSRPVFRAMQGYLVRLAEFGESLGDQNLRFMAQTLRKLAVSAPETLAEALQLILIFYSFQCELDYAKVRSLGVLDRLLVPFWRRDLESGRFTEPQLRELLKYFYQKISSLEVTANLPFSLCGNELTATLLEVYRELDIHDPKLHILYHPEFDPALTDLLLEIIREGKNSIVFVNTPVVSASLEKLGVAPADVAKVIVYGCYEPAAEGTEIPCTCGGRINLVQTLQAVLAQTAEFPTFEAFYGAVVTELEHITLACAEIITRYETHYEDVNPSLILSATMQTCRERNQMAFNGGAKYNNTSIVGAGLATLVDSLMAVKKAVYEEGLPLVELRQILAQNWVGYEPFRKKMQEQCAKFGNNDKEADALGAALANRFAALINNRPNGRGGVFRCGLFSVDWRFEMGRATAATPDGRKDGDPLSKNLAATVGQERNGVTAYLNSVLRLDATATPDGYVADAVLHCSAVRGEAGMAAFRSLLTSFMERGGFAIHFNVLNPATLRKAQKDPAAYRHLQVRLCGWNVRFTELDTLQQDEFIRQLEQNP